MHLLRQYWCAQDFCFCNQSVWIYCTNNKAGDKIMQLCKQFKSSILGHTELRTVANKIKCIDGRVEETSADAIMIFSFTV